MYEAYNDTTKHITLKNTKGTTTHMSNCSPMSTIDHGHAYQVQQAVAVNVLPQTLYVEPRGAYWLTTAVSTTFHRMTRPILVHSMHRAQPT